MIQIEDTDMPITVASKLISGTRPSAFGKAMKGIVDGVLGEEICSGDVDMFTVDELKEIADYLTIYWRSHQEGIVR